MINSRDKKPLAAVLDFGFRWHKWLVGDDTILTSVWALTSGTGLILENAFIKDESRTTGVWARSGTLGIKYLLTNTITTVHGRTMTQTKQITII